ncbi:MAG: UPF0149 family protein [Pseudomonadales bacterium]|nr:UPF0149 family protein [Pseudomonadales bacterium]
MKFNDLDEMLDGQQTPTDLAELHGRICGWLSAGAKLSDSIETEMLAGWQDTAEADLALDDVKLGEAIALLAGDIHSKLSDVDFGFQMLLPEDNVAINIRQQCISRWCAGFLSGFGLSGRFAEGELDSEIREVLTDLAQIAKLDENLADEIPEDDANESDVFEITEYVRMAALLVFTECASRALH